MKNQIEIYQKALIRHYNFIANKEVTMLNQIPEEKILFLATYSLRELCKPFVVADIQRGMSIKQIAIKYGLTVHTIRGIGRSQYLYSPRCVSMNTT